MQPIEMPAWRLTADSIWNSFQISGKKHLLLTGSRGAGKSTLLKKLMPEAAPGITTWVLPGREVRLRENGTDRETVIGRYVSQNRPPMTPVPEGFLGLGTEALNRCAEQPGSWVTVDEIGFLERNCPAYQQALLRLFEKKQVLGAVRKQELPFLRALLEREDAFVIDLDEPFGSTGCVIMASGLGQRFGGNKLMTDFLGEPMIARVLRATSAISRRVVVTRSEAVADYCREREIPVVLHALPYRSDTVRLGLSALKDTDRCLFCPGDQPLLREETVLSLALLGKALPGSICRPMADDQPGAPILFSGQFYPELLELPEGKGGGVVAKRHPDSLRLLPIRDRQELMDADTKEDLEQLLAFAGQ